MTFNDIKLILKNQNMRFSYEVDCDENIVAIYVEETGIVAQDKSEGLSRLMPDFHVSYMPNEQYILIVRKKSQ